MAGRSSVRCPLIVLMVRNALQFFCLRYNNKNRLRSLIEIVYQGNTQHWSSVAMSHIGRGKMRYAAGAALAAGLLFTGSSTAWAAPVTDTFVVSLASGSESLGGYNITDVFGGFAVD